MPREESFLIPLKYIDVNRSTHTDLDVAQERRIDDFWNVEENRSLSNSWTGFTRFTLLNETPPKGYMWSGRTDKNSNDITSRYGLTLGPELGKPLKEEKKKNGQSRNQNSNMPDILGESILLIRVSCDAMQKRVLPSQHPRYREHCGDRRKLCSVLQFSAEIHSDEKISWFSKGFGTYHLWEHGA